MPEQSRRGTRFCENQKEVAMQVIATQIKEEGGASPTFRVEFTGDHGEVISVFMRRDDDLSRDNAVARARDLISHVASSDIHVGSTS
jgi:hypothetical protein